MIYIMAFIYRNAYFDKSTNTFDKSLEHDRKAIISLYSLKLTSIVGMSVLSFFELIIGLISVGWLDISKYKPIYFIFALISFFLSILFVMLPMFIISLIVGMLVDLTSEQIKYYEPK